MAQPETSIPGIPHESQAAFEELMQEELRDAQALRAQIEGCLAMVAKYAVVNTFIDLNFVDQIAQACARLLEAFEQTDDEHSQRLIQAAVRYFALVEDSDNDLNSPTGFDDDAEVVRAVAAALDLEVDL